jgi:hypothetical protein
MVSGIRMRSGLLVLLSSTAVALAFGISFYFALVSSETAVTTQFPELAPIVSKLKTILAVNTVGVVAVIVASFWILSRMVTSKMFTALGRVMSGLRRAAENRYPEVPDKSGSGPFSDFESIWNTVVRETRSREKREIEILEKTLTTIPDPVARESVSGLIREKKRRIGIEKASPSGSGSGETGSDNPLFMQPV